MTIRASMMDQDPLKTLERNFPGSSGKAFFQSTQTTNLTAECIRTERDYYTRLSTLLDGSTFLNDIITEQKKDRSFMQCFDVEERTVPLDELCPGDDDTDDEDYGLDSPTTQQPETSILSPDTHLLPQGIPGSNSGTSSLATQSATKAEEDMFVSTKGAMFLPSDTSTAPHGSKKRDLQTRKQSYLWHVEDLCSSDISDPDFYQYDEDESLNESGSEDEQIDIFHRAAKHLQGDEYKAVRHALDVAAEKLVSPAIGFPPPGFAKEYHSRERKRMKEVHKLAEDDLKIQEKFPHAFKIQRLDASHD
ncbi:hypothetical protein BGZ47_001435 [Haplosporangium gracile]|nr:hypothetical protein BGZ47_001435 [Haplosporangium gracile]